MIDALYIYRSLRPYSDSVLYHQARKFIAVHEDDALWDAACIIYSPARKRTRRDENTLRGTLSNERAGELLYALAANRIVGA
jgi:hypothetical protein